VKFVIAPVPAELKFPTDKEWFAVVDDSGFTFALCWCLADAEQLSADEPDSSIVRVEYQP
jgi:hypothetical protein